MDFIIMALCHCKKISHYDCISVVYTIFCIIAQFYYSPITLTDDLESLINFFGIGNLKQPVGLQ